MFDFSFSEIALIGVVALVVIGPERLPKVARTTGVIVGRIQRYAAAVRADIAREVELSELRRVQNDLQDAAKSLETDLQSIQVEVKDHLVSADSLAPRVPVFEPTQQDLALEIPEETPSHSVTPIANAVENKA